MLIAILIGQLLVTGVYPLYANQWRVQKASWSQSGIMTSPVSMYLQHVARTSQLPEINMSICNSNMSNM